ncbi:MAG: hypothetical protein KDB63_11635 [Nocardioidaceae bacterium]|nr:hypothetical protein [Nocardioidaceae bacterium]
MGRRGTITALVLGLALAVSACTADVVPSPLPPSPAATLPGPAYALVPIVSTGPASVVVGGEEQSLGKRVVEVHWTTDGHLLATRLAHHNGFGYDLDLIDPATGEVLASRRTTADVGVTPGAVTVRASLRNRLTVLTPDLEHVSRIQVDKSAVQTDQLDLYSEFHLYGTPYTLDGVTWVPWGVNSEDDTKTDHGVLRIENGVAAEALRNQPFVRLQPSSDGAALLAVMQDNGEDESCGGCIVEQTVVELDPGTGEIAADYGTPPGYTRFWRIEELDKIGNHVVVRYRIGEAGEGAEPAWQTWIYDGDWRHETSSDGTRTSWQDGGRLVWRQTDLGRDEGEGAAFELTWFATGSTDGVVLVSGDDPCPRRHDTVLCPFVVPAGSLLPSSS